MEIRVVNNPPHYNYTDSFKQKQWDILCWQVSEKYKEIETLVSGNFVHIFKKS